MAYFRKYKGKNGDIWSFTVDVGRDPLTGKRKQITRRGFKTKKEAKEALDKLLDSLERSNNTITPDSTLEQYLEYWLENYAKPNLRVTTYDNRLVVINSRIIPALGHMKLNQITPQDVNRYYRELLKKYEPSYVHSIHRILRSAINRAVKWRIISSDDNFMDGVDAPATPKKKQEVWTLEQINKYLRTAKEEMPSDYYIAILNIAYTGLRRGEGLGLSWPNCDLDMREYHIKQTVIYTKSTGVTIQPLTKTETSERIVKVGDMVVEEMRWHKAQQNKRRLAYGPEYCDLELVSCREDGSPISPRQLLFVHERHVKRCGLPYIPIHGLRHTHATALLEAGVPPKTVQERLGHASITTTLDIYGHVTTKMQEEAVEKFEQALKNTF